jgi:glycosyltransferase involved in cell wall biosynthesis
MGLSVVIPTHDRATLLDGAIRSVLASPLVLSRRDVIVVDDQSEDETPEVARALGVRYVRIVAGGPSGARNAGLRLAEAEYIAFLDDDDAWLPTNMALQLAALQRTPAAAFAFGRVQRTNFELQPFGEPIPAAVLPSGNVLEFVYHFDLQLGAILFRRSALLDVGGFDEALRFNEDSDLLVRLAAKYPAVGVDVVGSLFRQRVPNLRDSSLRWPSHRDRLAAQRKWQKAGIRIPLRVRLDSDLKYRGMTSYFFCEDARLALTVGRKTEAAEALLRGLRLSPLHCLFGHRRLWSILPLFFGGQ